MLKAEEIMKSIAKSHEDFLATNDRLYESVSDLHYGGKCSFEKSLRDIDAILKYFRGILGGHIQEEEKVIFPFLNRHIPKLEPVLNFLRGDHKEFQESLISVDVLLKKLRQEKNGIRRRAITEKLWEKGIYLYCLIRNHIKAEDENVYKAIQCQLHRDERRRLAEELNRRKFLKKERGRS
ncbi:MAG: hemerythrin domain-containing protein [Candidatus Omnitrophota bacterium]|nr:hemerythrin domain-containing protein [Candidatus Omnitrophota bacterium]MDZ4242880.1 hemerythrin domain-containing protein [Candidatus Omnitrophota bacterium]